MSDVSSKLPETPGTVANEQVRANQEPALTETESGPREQPAPPSEEARGPEVDARTAANRANSLKSTGAKTPAGREASSKNAAKHCLFAEDLSKYFRTPEEAQRYQCFIDGIVKDLRPVGDYEAVLARRAADIQFRLDMLRTAELKIYGGVGIPSATMEGYLIHKEANPIVLASLYESRFQRSFKTTMDELRKAQQARRDQELHALEQLKGIALAHIQQQATFDPAKFGFVISRDFVFNQAHLVNARKLAQFCAGTGVVEKKVVDYVANVPKKAA